QVHRGIGASQGGVQDGLGVGPWFGGRKEFLPLGDGTSAHSQVLGERADTQAQRTAQCPCLQAGPAVNGGHTSLPSGGHRSTARARAATEVQRKYNNDSFTERCLSVTLGTSPRSRASWTV